ncbi:MAG: hypothetical protein JW891_05155 [Candidatus Lokiarchaeota archaeon]|nr:hypothetical protein [Candidatus Lokiarchaeota archaeon]
MNTKSIITTDKYQIEELLEKYAQAIDLLGLAELLPIEDHQRKVNEIRKLQNTLKDVSSITIHLK